jgi:hypothetical protein
VAHEQGAFSSSENNFLTGRTTNTVGHKCVCVCVKDSRVDVVSRCCLHVLGDRCVYGTGVVDRIKFQKKCDSVKRLSKHMNLQLLLNQPHHSLHRPKFDRQ